MTTTTIKPSVDITREIGQVRNSALPGANWLATSMSKIQLGFKDLQQQVQNLNTQQTTQQSLVVKETTVSYVAKYTDNVIINTAAAVITVTFPVDRGKFASWFVLNSGGTGSGATVNFAATNGTVLGSNHVAPHAVGLVVSDGNNLICGGS